jgi:ribosomal protein S27E
VLFDDLVDLEVLDAVCLMLPPRTPLLPLPPIGVGKPDVESLTSYLCRLAATYCVSVSDLVRSILALSRQSAAHEVKTHDPYTHPNALLGVTPIAQWWVTLLKRLTGVRDLHCLTLVDWSETFHAKGLLRRKRAWCSKCFQDWRTVGTKPYDRLAWALQAVTVCARHEAVLTTVCPGCSRESPVFSARMKPGRCSMCGQWLGDAQGAEGDGSQLNAESGKETQLVIAKHIGAMLAITHSADVSRSRIYFQSVLKSRLASLSRSSVSELARLLGLGEAVAYDYCMTTSALTMEPFLQVCGALQMPPVTMLVDTDSSASRLSHHTAHSITSLRRRKGQHLSPDDLTYVRATLEATLNGPREGAPSLSALADQLGCSIGALRLRFPDVCAAIVARGRRSSAEADRIMTITSKLKGALSSEEHVSLNEVVRRSHCSLNILKRHAPALCEALNRHNAPEHKRAIFRERLEQVLQGNEPRSVAACAREWHVTEATLRRAFPHLTQEVGDKFREHQHGRSTRRKQQEQQDVIDATLALYARGVYPSRKKVAAELGRSQSLFRKKETLQVFEKTRTGLGLRQVTPTGSHSRSLRRNGERMG